MDIYMYRNKMVILQSVVSGRKTMYTACLLYADEDELMAQLIIRLYKTAYKDALFFLPQFDLKHGKYILDTTAKVIDERCDKKVVFLLSEYFYASHICQFAVNYAAAHGTGHGNLIPFHLTRNVATVPNVLKGISGIRWFRKGTREHTWTVLTDSLLGEKVNDTQVLAEIKNRIESVVQKDRDYYLQDPPYDADVEPPGSPIEVIEPESSPDSLAPLDFNAQKHKLEEEMQKKQESKSKLTSMKSAFSQLKRVVIEKVLNKSHKSCSSQSGISNPSRSASDFPLQPIDKSQVLDCSKDSSKTHSNQLQTVGGNKLVTDPKSVADSNTSPIHADNNLNQVRVDTNNLDSSESKPDDCYVNQHNTDNMKEVKEINVTGKSDNGTDVSVSSVECFKENETGEDKLQKVDDECGNLDNGEPKETVALMSQYEQNVK